VKAIQRYELLRPILNKEKTPQQVSKELNVPLSTIYYYLIKLVTTFLTDILPPVRLPLCRLFEFRKQDTQLE